MNPISRIIARFMVALAVCLVIISTLAGLAGCNVTRATAAAAPAPASQPIDCGTWVDCA